MPARDPLEACRTAPAADRDRSRRACTRPVSSAMLRARTTSASSSSCSDPTTTCDGADELADADHRGVGERGDRRHLQPLERLRRSAPRDRVRAERVEIVGQQHRRRLGQPEDAPVALDVLERHHQDARRPAAPRGPAARRTTHQQARATQRLMVPLPARPAGRSPSPPSARRSARRCRGTRPPRCVRRCRRAPAAA